MPLCGEGGPGDHVTPHGVWLMAEAQESTAHFTYTPPLPPPPPDPGCTGTGSHGPTEPTAPG